jgi:RNA polymerase sigma-70 factor (ECF subfamily)
LDRDVTHTTDDLRPLMFSVAYGMLGSVAEAEDVASEATLRMLRETEPIRSPSAYAVTVTTRLAIDALRSARARREVYVGAWLPEPLVANDPAVDPPAQVEAAEQLSLALLVMLERLSPVERAVFLLREVFQYEYDRIAEIVERSEQNCRQILTRARAHVREDRPRFAPVPGHHVELMHRFLAAARSGDLAALEAVLADDITVTGDGGGKVPALATPVSGRLRVARFIIGLFRQAAHMGLTIDEVEVNGEPGGRVRTPDGQTMGVFGVDIVAGRVRAVYNVINPDKLAHLN